MQVYAIPNGAGLRLNKTPAELNLRALLHDLLQRHDLAAHLDSGSTLEYAVNADGMVTRASLLGVLGIPLLHSD